MNGLDNLFNGWDFDPNVYLLILFSSQKGLNTKVFLQYGSFDFLEKNSLSLHTLHVRWLIA